MNTSSRRALTAAGSAAVLAAGLGIAASGDASANSTMHTLTFVSVSNKGFSPTKNTFLSKANEYSHGKLVGYDIVSGRFNVHTKKVTLWVTLERAGGQLYARIVTGNSPSFTGRVTGGSGDFSGASGTVTGHSPSQHSNRTYVTVHYHL